MDNVEEIDETLSAFLELVGESETLPITNEWKLKLDELVSDIQIDWEF